MIISIMMILIPEQASTILIASVGALRKRNVSMLPLKIQIKNEISIFLHSSIFYKRMK